MPERPRGTVCFLFTDVVGSTRLWERYPHAMRAADARHDAILRGAIARHGGAAYKVVGDAFQAAFPSAPAAVAAALEAQRALAAEDWAACGLPEPVRVRVALHAGDVDPDPAGDYRSPVLNRLGRLLAAGHGGQVLLSQAAAELARDDLPAGAGLRDLGEHPLRDLGRRERVWQLLHPDLPGGFPPLATPASHLANLPPQPTPFLGREREVAQVADLLGRQDVRLLTLTGPGGIGKTRLAVQAAAELLDAVPDGAWFVDLAPLADPALVPATIAQVLGVREAGGRAPAEALAAALRDKELLLVLDNVEHLLEAAPTVAELLRACPGLTVLATSRAPLRLRGEREVAVPPLGLPAAGRPEPPEQLARSEAVRLFVERARDAEADFALTEANAPAVAEVVRRLDGLPLAIELAAARVKLFPPAALLRRLERRLPLLTGGARDAPARQRTLRDAIAWSYDLLAPDERTLFRRLAVFAGGCTLEAAEAVADPTGELGIGLVDGLTALVDQSLLRQEQDPDGEPRYRMLETVREFGLERLAAAGEEDEVRGRSAGYVLALAERAQAALDRPEEPAWMARLAAEHDNLRAALAWAVDRGDAEAALRLGGALWDFWYIRGHLGEGRRWLEAGLAIGAEAPAPLRARALLAAGQLAHYQGDAARAAELLGQTLALYRELGDPRGTGHALLVLGVAAVDRGEYDGAASLLAEARARFEEAGFQPYVSLTIYHLGVVAHGQGDLGLAAERYEEALRLARALGHKFNVAATLGYVGLLACERGDPARAAAAFAEALALAQETADPEGIVRGLANAAVLAALTGRPEPAARLFGAAEGLRARIDLLPFALPERLAYERAMEAARASLGAAAYGAAWTAGRALSPEEAIAETQTFLTGEGRAPRSTPPPPSLTDPAAAHGLTPREVDVLRLLAQGRTNEQIGEALFISPRTAQTHVTRLLAKLGLANRTEAAAFAHRHGLA